MSLGAADQRVLLVRSLLPDSRHRIGTGTLIADRLAVTAAHVVFGDNGAPLSSIRIGSTDTTGPPEWGGLAAARVAWPETYLQDPVPGRGTDLALLEITDAQWVPPRGLSGSVRFGVLTSRAAGIPVEAIGYPRALRESDGLRVEEHLSATINPSGGRIAGRYDLHLTSSAPTEPDSWSGASGAAVFIKGLLTAVLILDTPGYGHSRISAVPISRLLTIDAALEVLTVHGVPAQAQSVELAHLLHFTQRSVPAQRGIRRSPAALLRPEAEIVRFSGRTDILEQLINWCTNQDLAMDVRLIVGPGGQGKTRLAHEFLAIQAMLGWVSGFLRPDPIGLRYPALDLAPIVDTASRIPGILIAVDYAETRSNQLDRLLQLLSQSTDLTPIRLLLMARSGGGWWDELKRRYPDLLDRSSELPLAGLNMSPESRRKAFGEATLAFVAKDALPAIYPDHDWDATARHVVPPLQLADPIYSSPLSLQLSALIYLLESAQILEYGTSDELEERLLAHEQCYWNDTADAAGLPFREPYQRPTLSYFVAAANLFGAKTEVDAKRLLGRLPAWNSGDEVIRGVADWLHRLYPPDDGDSYWGALQPDRLAEYHLRALARQQSDLLQLLFKGASADETLQAAPLLSRATRVQDQLMTQLDEFALLSDAESKDVFISITQMARSSVGRSSTRLELARRRTRYITTSGSDDLNTSSRSPVRSSYMVEPTRPPTNSEEAT